MNVILTTRLPPATCGIGTYSALLRTHWPGADAVEFLVLDGAAAAQVAGRDRVTEFHGDGRKLQRELERIGRADVLLHYAARAYHRRGCPIWLPGVLARWKGQFAGARLMIMVHEMPGRLPLRSPHYWLAQVNTWIVRRLAATADVLVTNTAPHARELERITGRSDVQLLPVGSNVGANFEPGAARPATEFALFGLSFGRMQTLQKFHAHVPRWHAAGLLTRLHLLGPGDDEFSRQADAIMQAWPREISVVRHGLLPPAEVSRRLETVRYALTNVTEATWSKSTAFMACAAHGCAPVLAQERPASVPLCYGVAADELPDLPEAELARRTSALAEWYREHAAWPVIARRMASLW